MAWDREFAQLEHAIRQLGAAYDAFLYGSAARPPLEIRKQVDQTFRRLSASDPETAADEYRLTTLQTHYAALCERWERLQSEKEAGKRPGAYARFSRSGSESPDTTAPNAAASSSVRTSGEAAPRPEGPAADPSERHLFERYIAAKKGRGEDVSGYDFPRFAEALQREREKVKQRLGSVELEFDLVERYGRVKLVARRKGG